MNPHLLHHFLEMARTRTHYEVLGVLPSATDEKIRSAYRSLAKACHPDRGGGDIERFHRIQQAYEVLCDPSKRRAYDGALKSRRDRAIRFRQARETGMRSSVRTGSLDAVFRSMFGRAEQSDQQQTRRRRPPVDDPSYSDEGTNAGRYAADSTAAADIDYDIFLSPQEAANGIAATLATDWGPSVDVQIPPGVYHGEVLTVSFAVNGRTRRLSLLIHVKTVRGA